MVFFGDVTLSFFEILINTYTKIRGFTSSLFITYDISAILLHMLPADRRSEVCMNLSTNICLCCLYMSIYVYVCMYVCMYVLCSIMYVVCIYVLYVYYEWMVSTIHRSISIIQYVCMYVCMCVSMYVSIWMSTNDYNCGTKAASFNIK